MYTYSFVCKSQKYLHQKSRSLNSIYTCISTCIEEEHFFYLTAFCQENEEKLKLALEKRKEVPFLPIEDTIWLIEEIITTKSNTYNSLVS